MAVTRKKFETNAAIKDRQQFEIVKRTERSDVIGVKVGDRELAFGKKSNAFITDDAGLAHEIHDTQGQGGTGDVLVIPYERHPHRHHTRTFIVPSLPWHEKEKGE